MVEAVRDRRDARVYAYSDREELIKQGRLFVRISLGGSSAVVSRRSTTLPREFVLD